MSSPQRTVVSRRAALGAAPAIALSALALGACSDDAPPSEPAPVDPDVALREAAAERERELLRSYDAVLAALPALAPRLVAVRGHHAEHLLALQGPPGSPSAAAPSETAGAPSGAPVPPAPPAVPPPADAAEALARLAEQERAVGDAHAAACTGASRSLAGVLASLSASEVSHPVALR